MANGTVPPGATYLNIPPVLVNALAGYGEGDIIPAPYYTNPAIQNLWNIEREAARRQGAQRDTALDNALWSLRGYPRGMDDAIRMTEGEPISDVSPLLSPDLSPRDYITPGVDPGALELSSLAVIGRPVASFLGNALRSVYDFISVPGDIAKGKYTESQLRELAPSYALGLAGANIPVASAMIPKNALGIFAGTRSLTAPLDNLELAKMLEVAGQSRDQIHAATSWFRGPDKQWRYTISDAPARVVGESVPGTLPELLIHPDLYAAYPALRNYLTDIAPTGAKYTARLNPGFKSFELNPEKISTPQEALSSVLHETQHAVQGIEEFAPGGSREQFLPEYFETWVQNAKTGAADLLSLVKQTPGATLADVDTARKFMAGILPSDLGKQRLQELLPQPIFKGLSDHAEIFAGLNAINRQAFQNYLNLGGEVEARGVQEQLARRDWATPPWQHEGYIPFEQQIINPPFDPRFFSLVPVDHDPFALVPVDHDPFGGK